MRHPWMMIAAAACVVAAFDAASAAAKHRTRHARAAPRASAIAAQVPPHSGRSEPARMIEIRPGLFVSTYDCISDDGYGRFTPCSSGSGGGGGGGGGGM